MATLTNVISNATGNVGIGTTVPKAKINIANPSGTVGALSDSSLFLLFNNATAQSAVGFNHGKIGWTGYNRTVLSAYIESGIDAGTFDDHGYIAFGNSNASATATVERMRIAQDGSVLIGVTGAYNSSRLLQVKDGLLIGNSFYTFASIDTNSTADLILSSNANPANLGSNSNIIFKLGTSAGGGPDEKMRIISNGNVGIGTSSPSSAVSFNKVVEAYDATSLSYQVNSGGTYKAEFGISSNGGWLGTSTTHDMRFASNGTERMRINTGGNVGIGTTSPTGQLHIYSSTSGIMKFDRSASSTFGFEIGATTFGLYDYTNSEFRWRAESRNLIINESYGNVGIGTTAPAAKLEISGSSNSVLLNIKSAISGAILYVSGSGAVGIGTSNVGAYTLQVSGSFAATTKSFVIEHPTKAGKKLIYGSLESPYHGIRLTGRDTLKEGKCKIQLPDYIYKLILHDSVNIQLTGIKCNKTLYIDDINIPENYFTIAYDKTVFESYKDYDFFWDFTAIRADVPELQTEM